MNSESIKFLAWDSHFFNKKVGKIDCEQFKLIEQLNRAKQEKYDLIYAFSAANIKINNEVLYEYGGKLVDKKIVYEKRVQKPIIFTNSIECCSETTTLTPEIEKLAYISGKYSRFKTDRNFDKQDFYRMYKMWIEKSLSHEITDWVFVVNNDSKIAGMVTLSVENKTGHIGLISVSPEIQGKGFGKLLIQVCENKLNENGISKLEVPTQLNNRQACEFYNKCGFTIKSITNIYHFWL